jgi:hypothetical protein
MNAPREHSTPVEHGFDRNVIAGVEVFHLTQLPIAKHLRSDVKGDLHIVTTEYTQNNLIADPIQLFYLATHDRRFS